MSGRDDEAHLSENSALDLVQGSLTPDLREQIQRHLDLCDGCRRLVAATLRALKPIDTTTEPDAPPADADRRLLRAGDRIDRYVIEELVGAGGMGLVYAARDPQLGRKVALKVLRPELGQFAEIQKRLLRESRALARLSHPNVVQVFDVGSQDGDLFIAMEFVEGITFAAWCQRYRPEWRRVVEVLRYAGAGLAAAHAAGLVHRDFKPENVLVEVGPGGRPGRVRVSDFGLARGQGEVPITLQSPHPAAGRLTRTGALLGTPAYMAPEQYYGEEVDARSDVFSFCATLFEAIYGARAFPGKTVHEIAAAMEGGKVKLPDRPHLPARLARLLNDGLAVDRRKRPSSMADVLPQLRTDRLHRRHLLLAGGLALTLAAGAAAWVVAGAAIKPGCGADAESRLERVWNRERRSAMRQWPAARDAVDGNLRGWLDAEKHACKGTNAAAARARLACLDAQLAELHAALDLAMAEPADFDEQSFVANLPDRKACRSP